MLDCQNKVGRMGDNVVYMHTIIIMIIINGDNVQIAASGNKNNSEELRMLTDSSTG